MIADPERQGERRTVERGANGDDLMSVKNAIPSGGRPSPFVKWAGGKRQLLKELTQRLPKTGKYKCMNFKEIFGGGGGVTLLSG